MKNVFKISLFSLTIFCISLSPKAFASSTNFDDKNLGLSQSTTLDSSFWGNHGDWNNKGDWDDQGNQGNHGGNGNKCPVTPEPMNGVLFLAGALTLAVIAFRKKLKLA